ncbi:hypothetical protein GB937_006572 [Aspergillus fischeri]|nr:hypothetical protein GB937_006572 [Aspergillus fischeri]
MSILATHESPHYTVPIVIAHQAQQQTGREAMWALGKRPEQICHGRPRAENGPTILHIKVNKLVQFAITRGQRPAVFPHIGDMPENHAMVNAPNLAIDSHHDDDAVAWLH